MLLTETGRRRALVQNVAPEIDDGEFPVKRSVGQTVRVSTDALSDGHDELSCRLKYRPADEPSWNEVAMEALGNDRWEDEWRVTQVGRYKYTVEAWGDHFRSWRNDLKKRREAGQLATMELKRGADLVRQAVERADRADNGHLPAWAAILQEADSPAAVGLALSDPLQRQMAGTLRSLDYACYSALADRRLF
jgi:starch synthase (maltosyl-transferring)